MITNHRRHHSTVLFSHFTGPLLLRYLAMTRMHVSSIPWSRRLSIVFFFLLFIRIFIHSLFFILSAPRDSLLVFCPLCAPENATRPPTTTWNRGTAAAARRLQIRENVRAFPVDDKGSASCPIISGKHGYRGRREILQASSADKSQLIKGRVLPETQQTSHNPSEESSSGKLKDQGHTPLLQPL